MILGVRISGVSGVVGLALIAWYRRNVINFIIVPVAIAVALKIAAAATSGAAAAIWPSIL